MKLTIGVLISNRIETVKKCLESVKPLVDKGIAELICVDTITGTHGKISDGSADLAKKYTDKVFVFPWINDFSAARNVTLEHASGEWYMFSDDDEWFEDVDEILDFFTSGEYLKYNSASYVIRNYKNKMGTEWADTRAVRLVKRTNDLRFVGRVHENYSSIKLPCKEFSSFAHHYGYVFDSEEDKKKHRDRNLTLLEEEIKQRPDDLRLYAQKALELATFDNDGALKFIEESLKRFHDQKEENYYQWLISLKFPLYEALDWPPEDVEEIFKKTGTETKLSETAILSIHYNLTRKWLLADNKEKALPHIKEYFRLSEVLKKDATLRQMQNTADFEKYLSSEKEMEMNRYKEYCMDSNGLKIGHGTISFGSRKIILEGSLEEKIAKLEAMPFEDFKTAINSVIAESKACFDDEVLNSALEHFSQNGQIKYCFILYRMTEEEIKRAVKNGAKAEAFFDLFVQCICTERKMYELLYKPEVFSKEGLNWVESEVRYNDILYRFVSDGGKDLKLCLEAAKIRPDMANVIKIWLGALR